MSLHPKLRIYWWQQRGFTLLEVLASLLIVSIAITALLPSIVVAAATRIQTQRVEAGTNLAYQELDRIRGLIDQGVNAYTTQGPAGTFNRLPRPGANFSVAHAGVSPPSSIPTTPGAAVDLADSTVRLSADGQFAIQSFRNVGQACVDANNAPLVATDPTRPCSFRVGVRVYSRLAFDASGSPVTTLSRDPMSTYTQGVALLFRSQPVAVLTAEVGTDLRLYCLQAGNNPAQCPVN